MSSIFAAELVAAEAFADGVQLKSFLNMPPPPPI
jgi:hypothetical protein